MDDQPLPRWMIGLTVFLAFGLICAACLYTGPAWAHWVRLPARAARAPTATLAPTLPPIPTPIPSLRDDPQVQAYLSEVSEPLTIMKEAFDYLSVLLQSPSFEDPQWVDAVLVLTEVVKNAHNEIEFISVPARMRELHTGLVSGTRDCHSAANPLASGVENLSVNQMNMAIQRVLSCGEKLTQSAKELEALMAEAPTPLPAPTPTPTGVPLPTFTRTFWLPTPTPAPTFTWTPLPTHTSTPFLLFVPTWPVSDDSNVINPAPSCCKVCTTGKACGNSCIARSKECHQPPGCACDG